MNISGVTKHFATPSEVYTNNLSASISAGAVTVPVNANNDYTDGDIVVLTVEPGTTNEATFTGEKASTPARFINCVWTEGNVGVGHASGVTITDYDSATHVGMMTKGIKVHANQDGTLKTSAVQAALNISSAVPSDYTSLAQTATTVTPAGNGSYSLLFPGVNYTDRLSPGMRLRTVRQAAAPNQCALFDGVNDYFSDSSVNGMTFTDDFTVSAWVKLDRYGAPGVIVSRYNGTNGWRIYTETNGQLTLAGNNGASTNYSLVTSAQSLPLNRWVHITAQLDMSSFTATPTTSYFMFDGLDVPSSVIRAGTNPTALVQAGNLEIGSQNGGTFFPGKIAQVAIFNQKVTQATIRSYMSQTLSGSETGVISAYTLSNSVNDLNITNANNLTANGGVLTTVADSPFGIQGDGTVSTTVDYGIVQKVTYGAPDTTVVVQVPEGGTIPTSGGVASVSYSQFRTPYLFPSHKNKWSLKTIGRVQSGVAPVVSTWYRLGTLNLDLPIGAWTAAYDLNYGGYKVGSTSTDVYSTLSKSSTVEDDKELSTWLNVEVPSAGTSAVRANVHRDKDIEVSAMTTHYLLFSGGATDVRLYADVNSAVIKADNAYL